MINKKKTYRLYKEEALQVRIKKRKRLQRPRIVKDIPRQINERWSMDFVHDQLSNGRRFRVLNVIDDFSREVIGQLVSFSISGYRVARFLSEFTSKAMFFWSQVYATQLAFIQPGKPTQNVFVESLNGKLRNECLNLHWFRSIEEARDHIEIWRDHYNHQRPHSSLNYMSPVAFAKQAA